MESSSGDTAVVSDHMIKRRIFSFRKIEGQLKENVACRYARGVTVAPASSANGRIFPAMN